ncbi:MAG: class I SAM-dependent methyltransferase [Gammaproteobacteria bacterium]
MAFAYSHTHGAFDALSVERAGLVRLEGWDSSPRIQDVEIAKCLVDDNELPVLEAFRTYRPDVAAATGSDNAFLGLAVLYGVPAQLHGVVHRLKVTHREAIVFELNDAFQTENPPYSKLFDSPDVLHRENVYGYGPPTSAVAEEIKRLGLMLPGPVLDFGCGSGVLIKLLRARNIEAHGIEIDRKAVSDSLLPEVREHIQLYDGRFPLPFADGQFESVIASEVIEHVPAYEDALDEIARVTRRAFLITVPDMSSVPLCHHNHVVPWHLLESTHVNFFTQSSLRKVLKKRFTDVQFMRICPTVTNGSKWFGSLAAICEK